MFGFGKKRAKIFGEAVIVTNSSEKIFVQRYITTIYKNNNDATFCDKLRKLGFDDIEESKSKVTTMLPVNWIHFQKNKNEELICDDKGRVRLVIVIKEKTTIILRRYNTEVQLIESPPLKLYSMYCKIYDSGYVASEFTIQDKDREIKFWEKSDMTKDEALKVGTLLCEARLNDIFPEWRDELAYWD